MIVNGYTSKAAALRDVNALLTAHGLTKVAGLLSCPEANPKVAKNGKVGALSFPMHLSPAKISGFEVCPMRSAGCTEACLHTAGNPAYKAGKYASRFAKTQAYFRARKAFMAVLVFEIAAAERKAEKAGMTCGIRLNATSDIFWESVGFTLDDMKVRSVMDAFPKVEFYDYTKVTKRAMSCALKLDRWPSNYHLTFSRAEDNDRACFDMLNAGGNVSVVFDHKGSLPAFVGAEIGYGGECILRARDVGRFEVIDGDDHDFRPVDPKGVVVGLKAKGDAKGDTSGFVLR